MPSQQLPKSSKVETLPDDLKAIAERLIRKKFDISHEPELMEKKQVKWEQPNPNLVSVQLSSRDISYSEIFKVDLSIGSDVIRDQIKNRLYHLTRKYGAPFEARILDGGHPTTYTQNAPYESYYPGRVTEW